MLIGAVVTLVAAGLSLYYRKYHAGLTGPTSPGASPDDLVTLVTLSIALVGVFLGGLSIVLRPTDHHDLRRGLELWSLRIFAFGVILLALEVVLPQLIDALRKDPEVRSSANAGALPTKTVGAGITLSFAGILATIVAQARAQIADPAHAVRAATGWFGKLAPQSAGHSSISPRLCSDRSSSSRCSRPRRCSRSRPRTRTCGALYPRSRSRFSRCFSSSAT